MIKYIVNCVNIINHIQNNVTSVTNVDKYLPAYNDNIKSIVNEILADNNMESLNLIEGFDSLLLRYIISSLIVFSKSNKVEVVLSGAAARWIQEVSPDLFAVLFQLLHPMKYQTSP